jgi:hypothetical protein
MSSLLFRIRKLGNNLNSANAAVKCRYKLAALLRQCPDRHTTLHLIIAWCKRCEAWYHLCCNKSQVYPVVSDIACVDQLFILVLWYVPPFNPPQWRYQARATGPVLMAVHVVTPNDPFDHSLVQNSNLPRGAISWLSRNMKANDTLNERLPAFK